MTQLITPHLLRAAGATEALAQRWLPHVRAACGLYGIDTPARLAAFLAQIGHESGGFRYTTEIWGPTPAQQRYEGRADLGNTQPGDGARYKGHGLIQTTGRYNHARVRDRLRARLGPDVPDFEAQPDLLAADEWAATSAADYWDDKGLNTLADQDTPEAFLQITRSINGGINGHADRVARWDRLRVLLAGPAPDVPVQDLSTPYVHTNQPSATPARAPLLQRLGDFISPAALAADTTPRQEPPMPPFIAAVLPSLIDLVPKLGTLFASGSATSERNIKAAQIVVDAAKAAIQAKNEQDLLEQVQANPDAAQAVRAAIEAKWFELTEVGGGLQAARAADQAFAAGPARPWNSPSLWIALALLPLVYAVVGSVVGWWGTPFSDDVRSAIANGVMSLVLGGLIGYYFGQTTSRNRTPGGQ
ncbi:hypothetical protein [Acidovorax lacteus]|uniref:Glycoside hydrolase family 19 protein n=1 Tax=Acidovorax lacteus TaxID=1924988 RepID=A0ABP8LA49_9BURK